MNAILKSDVIIVGGVAAGPKTAATLLRRNPDLKVTLFEKSRHISFATCGLPYFASGDLSGFKELTLTPYNVSRDIEFFKKSKSFEVITETEVTEIDRDNKIVTVRNSSGEVSRHQYEYLVLATGSRPQTAPFDIPKSEKIRHFTRPEDAIAFRQAAQTGQIGKTVIIGGGFIGCELAEAVSGMWGIETVLIEKERQLLAYILDFEMSEFVMGELKRNDITMHAGCSVQKIELNEEGLPVVFMDNGEKIETDYVFLCLGVEPAVDLATAAGLEIGETGAIAVNENLQTSDPHIYAGGDCIESRHLISGEKIHIRMGSLANRHGYVIAENIIGNKIRFPSITGACLIKVFDLNIGSVGLTERSAAAAGLAVKAVYGTFADKPDYHPESKLITVKMLYDNNDRLIGLQAVGEGDVCRRVDTFSVMLQKGATIDDLYDFEHGYAPPYAEGLDPLHQLAGVARAEQRGYKFVNPAELHDGENIFCLDVREVFETETTWPGLEKIKKSGRYINIPLNDLPDNIDKLNPKARILIICGRGSRSYQAAVMLKAAGFKDVVVIGGGTKAAMSQSPGE